MKTPDATGTPPSDDDAALRAVLPHLRLPPKRKGPVRLPPRREGPVLPQLEKLSCRCPYCHKDLQWPPEGLRCPACGRTLRPPPGFSPDDAERRREAKERIAEERDAALRRLGPRASFGGPNNKPLLIGATLFLLVLAIALSFASSGQRRSRPELEPYPFTTNALAVYGMALEHFRIDCGRYPLYEEGGLLALLQNPGIPGWSGNYVKKAHNDGWNSPFFYDCTNGVPILYSFGPDRKPQTGDDLHLRPDQLRPHPDFVPHRGAGGGIPATVIIDPALSRRLQDARAAEDFR